MTIARAQSSLWDPAEYALLDCGAGRKLERFGGMVLDRPAPPARNVPRTAKVDWRRAAARLDTEGRLVSGAAPDGRWQARFGSLVFNLALTPFGHVGLFPEQAANWQWLTTWLASWAEKRDATNDTPPQALNLFAYTGGSTLALAAAGAHVVHVDASAPAVKWARRNAQDSRLSDRPIRWIVEDARKFVAREIRRGNRYQLIVLDPPSFGHGPNGKRWSIEADFDALLSDCIELLASGPSALLLTAHCEHPNECEVAELVQRRDSQLNVTHGRLHLGNPPAILDAGYFVRGTR